MPTRAKSSSGNSPAMPPPAAPTGVKKSIDKWVAVPLVPLWEVVVDGVGEEKMHKSKASADRIQAAHHLTNLQHDACEL
jgi:hypothetical protein